MYWHDQWMTKFDLTRGSSVIFLVFALFAQHRKKFPLQLFGVDYLHQHFFFLIHISERRFSQIITILFCNYHCDSPWCVSSYIRKFWKISYQRSSRVASCELHIQFQEYESDTWGGTMDASRLHGINFRRSSNLQAMTEKSGLLWPKMNSENISGTLSSLDHKSI